MAQEISVGSLVRATRDSGVCKTGEVGVCYEIYELGNRPGYNFIFERGGYDGFSPDDVKMFLDVSGRVSRDAARYQFRNVGQLDTDYRAGRFDAAFKEQNHAREDAAMEAAWERSAIPPPRDLLKREMREEAKGRPRDVALEKHGADIEMDIMRDLERMREAERQPGHLDWPEAHEPETERERESGIKEVSRSDWQMQDDGLTEQFIAVGARKQGFHYAIFTSYRGGDDYRWSKGPPWSEQAFPTQNVALNAAHTEMRHVDYDNPYEPQEPDWPQAREESTREPQEPDSDLER